MAQAQEVELKLELAPEDVERFRASPLLGAPDKPASPQLSTYYDTPQGDIRKAGYTLRVRRKGRRFVQTVKSKGGDSGGFSARAEWESRIAGPGVDFDALKATPVAGVLARKRVRKALEIVSETRVDRTIWMLGEAGATIELILDVGEVAAGTASAPVCEAELELKRGGRKPLFDLALAIALAVPLRLGVMSKSERGFALASGKKRRIHKAEPVAIEPGTPIADALAAIVQSCLRHFRCNEPAAGLRDAEAVHQLRVAIRRLRSALGLFRPVAEDGQFETLRLGLRALSATLGVARDLDVLLIGLRKAGRRGAAAEIRRLKAARDRAYDELLATLASDELPRLLLTLVAWAEAGDWREAPRARRSVDAFAEERLGRLWRRIRKAGKDIFALDPEARHALRIEVKKLRYAAEFFADLAPGGGGGRKRWKGFVGNLARLQESLGTLNDIEAAKAAGAASVGATPEADTGALLAEAQAAHDALREAGPYWR